MRILRLNSISGPPGGVEAYIHGVDRLLYQLGHRIETITFGTEKGTTKEDNRIFIRAPATPMKRVFNDIIPSEAEFDRLITELNNFDPDIIHLHHFRIGFATIRKLIMSVNAPVVFTAHDALAVCPLSTLVKPGNVICEGGVSLRCGFTGCRIHSHLPYELILSKAFKDLSQQRIKAFICPSYAIMKYLYSFRFRPAIHLPSFSYFEPEIIRNEPRYDEILLRKNIGYIGRLEEFKGIDDLIMAFSRFSSKHPEFNLLIAGSGPYEKKLRNLVKKLSVETKVKFLGPVSGERKEKFYESIFCNVVPSKYWENLSFSAQESLLRGVPTIGTRIGGIPELIRDGINGFTVPIGSPEIIAERFETILSDSDNQIINMMKNGRTFVLKNFTPERHIKGLMDIYSKVVNGETITDCYDANPIIH